MRLSTVAVLGATLAAGLGAGAPAYAVTFADYSASSSFDNIVWTQSNSGTSGTLATIGSPGAAVNFQFLTPSLSALGELPAVLVYKASGPSSDAATAAGGYLIQPNLSGSFRFIYEGSGFTANGNTYNAGATLLQGSFKGTDIVGQNGSSAGNVNDATLSGGTITYSSPILKFGSGDKSYSIEMTSIANPLGANAGQSLNSFGAVSTGSFESVLSGGGNLGVPEPSTWALMLIGVGALGSALRRRSRATAS